MRENTKEIKIMDSFLMKKFLKKKIKMKKKQ